MAIQTTVEPRVKWWTVAYLVVCVAIGVWGLYDYAVRLPANQERFERFQRLAEERASFEQLSEVEITRLSQERRDRWVELNEEFAEFATATPVAPAAWDRWVKFWIYFVLSGVVGGLWFGVALVSLLRKRYRLDDDGTLTTPEGSWRQEEIAGIDMDRWMEKSIATVVRTDGTRVKLDAYKHRDLHLIIGEIAHRFEPQRWHRDARMVKPGAPASETADAEARASGVEGGVTETDGLVRPDDGSDADAAAPAADGAGPADPTRT